MESEQFVFIKNNDDNTMLVYWLETNKLKTIPKPKFTDGQFVETSGKRQSHKKDFVQLFIPVFADKPECWQYGIKYINRSGHDGGSSFYWDEDEFLPLSNPLDILFAKKVTLECTIKELSFKLKRSNDELDKINFSITLINKETDLGGESS